ncbi:MAG: hypothetical protein V4647_02365 [Pseudomonadota bacterium]
MIAAFTWIEQTRISVFMREDFYAYFVALIGHAWGMALLVGGGLAICLRVLGIGRSSDLAKWSAVLSLMKWGAVLAAVSGLALLAGYPVKALTNWVFALKFACLIGAAWLTVRALREGSKPRAALALPLWLGGVAAGKLLLYTYHALMAAELAG